MDIHKPQTDIHKLQIAYHTKTLDVCIKSICVKYKAQKEYLRKKSSSFFSPLNIKINHPLLELTF